MEHIHERTTGSGALSKSIGSKYLRIGRAAVVLAPLALCACAITQPVAETATPADDAPRNAIVVSGNVQAKLFIAENGRPQKCIVLASSGEAAFDRMTCQSLIRTTRFVPAKDVNGQRIRRVIVRSAALGSPGAQAIKLEDKGLPEFIFLVNQLPDGQSSTATRVEVQVDALGAITSCHAAPTEKDAELAEMACGSLSVVWKPMREQDDSGTPFRYVREFQVELRHTGVQRSAI
jgi:hypothetical protein